MAEGPPTGARLVSRTLIVGLFVSVLVGRFTLDRVGIDALGEFDLRLAGCVVLALAVVVWRLHPRWAGKGDRFVPSVKVMLALFALEAISALWAPAHARLDERLTDVGVLAVMVVLTVLLVAADPVRAQRCFLWCAAVAGTIYALGGLLVGEVDPQGRTVFLGGGPNIYVRVICVGVLALVALAVVHRSVWPALLVPLLASAAVLSGSRGGLMAAVFTTALFVVLFRKRLSPRVVLLGLVLGGGVMASFVLGGGATLAVKRFTDAFTGADLSDRPELFDKAWSMFLEHPVLGGGLDVFYISYGQNVAIDYSHNLILDIASTLGLVGLGLLALFAVLWLKELIAVPRLGPEQIALALAAAYVLIGSMSSGDFYDSRFLWVFAAAAVTPMTVLPAVRPIRSPGPTARHADQLVP